MLRYKFVCLAKCRTLDTQTVVSSLLQLLKISYGSSPQGPGLKAGMATSWWWKEEVEVKQPSWHWNRVGAGRGRFVSPRKCCTYLYEGQFVH